MGEIHRSPRRRDVVWSWRHSKRACALPVLRSSIRFSFQAPPRVASEWLRRLRVKRVEAGIGVVERDLFPRAPLVKSTSCVCKA